MTAGAVSPPTICACISQALFREEPTADVKCAARRSAAGGRNAPATRRNAKSFRAVRRSGGGGRAACGRRGGPGGAPAAGGAPARHVTLRSPGARLPHRTEPLLLLLLLRHANAVTEQHFAKMDNKRIQRPSLFVGASLKEWWRLLSHALEKDEIVADRTSEPAYALFSGFSKLC